MADRKAHNRREKGFIFYHGERTAKLSINLRKRLIPNDDFMDEIIYTSALFHDIGKGIEPHNEIGAVLAENLLKGYCSSEELDSIKNIIRFHNIRGNDCSCDWRIKIIQDADILDHMGTIEIWMNFLYSASEEASIDRSLKYWTSDEFHKSYDRLRKLLNYDLSMEVFDEKRKFLKKFVQRLEIELAGGLI